MGISKGPRVLRANLSRLQGFAVAACLALLAGCIPQPLAPPADVPADLVAFGDNATVTLTWTASAGATSYRVRRATVGGPYTQVAAPITAGYMDSAVTNGTTYYYVISQSTKAVRVRIPRRSP